MRQTIVSVVLPVPDQNATLLKALIEEVRLRFGAARVGALTLDAIPGLHFLSIQLFEPDTGVPPGDRPVARLFVFEVDADGTMGPICVRLEAVLGELLRDMLRCCQAPDSAGARLFAAVTAPFSRVPIAPVLEAYSAPVAAAHRGNRGLARARILRHDALFQAIQALLPELPSDMPAQDIHRHVRNALIGRFAWLNESWQAPIPPGAILLDRLCLVGFIVAVIAIAALPWLLAGAAIGPVTMAIAALLTGAACLIAALRDIGDVLTAFGLPSRQHLWALAAFGLQAAAVILAWQSSAFLHKPNYPWLFLAVSGAASSLLLLLAAVRLSEQADAVPDLAVPDPDHVRAMQRWEQNQPDGGNHMASVVLLKPGWFRAFLVRFGMLGVSLTVRVTGNRGYLGSIPSNRIMRTIHFAHWCFVDRGTRLLFISNFDGTWDSYLDDFIEKESVGLTLAWSNGLGFPPARYMSLDGATHGPQFKAWARLSMVTPRFFYAAYPHLTVNQIWRQATIARGLASRSLNAARASAWLGEL